MGENDWLVFGRDFTVRTIAMETVRFAFYNNNNNSLYRTCEKHH